MTNSYERRLVALERRASRVTIPRLRVIHTIISPETQDVEGVHVDGQHFDRAKGESVDELEQRAVRAVGGDG